MRYAWYNPYGRIAMTSFNGNPGYTYLAFATKKERDAWVDRNYWDGCNQVAGEATRKEVVSYYGKYFEIHDGVCIWEGEWPTHGQVELRKR